MDKIIPTEYNITLDKLRKELSKKYPPNSLFWIGFDKGIEHYVLFPLSLDLDQEYLRIKESIKTMNSNIEYYSGFAYGFWFSKEDYKKRVNSNS